MVDLKEAMEPEYPKRGRKMIHSETLVEDYNARDGYQWTISPTRDTKELEVWTGERGHRYYVRQELAPCPQFPSGSVDIISMTAGQVYDLIKSLTRALEV